MPEANDAIRSKAIHHHFDVPGLKRDPNLIAHLGNERWISEPQALEGTVRAKRARAARLPQRLRRCVAIWCDAQRRVAERYDAPRRAVLPTMMSISPTRLIDDPNMMQSRVNFKTAPLP